ncbi:MAG: hypothetical protein EPN62_00765 [Candidimonas sp.]|nr:MAG: hypothetical protein EPN77_01765 [Candidimonas sp.]TAM26862.1 MAG: hypothetical protein EPN62_00765 [Candidimonas sp.]
MPLIPFPNVPDVPGVPAIARSVTVPTSLTGIFGLAVEAFGDFMAARWGVFDAGGNRVLMPDSFLGIDFKNDSRQSNYPVEGGGFESYNKVDTPYDARVTMAIGGDEITRTLFLSTCDAMLHSINRYTVVTPEVTYDNASLVNLLYRRETKNGATMLTIQLWFNEVRTNAVALFSGTNPASSDVASDGAVQSFPIDGPGSVSAPNLSSSTSIAAIDKNGLVVQ